MATMGQRGQVNPSDGRPALEPLLTHPSWVWYSTGDKGGSASVTSSKSHHLPRERQGWDLMFIAWMTIEVNSEDEGLAGHTVCQLQQGTSVRWEVRLSSL